MEYDDWLFDSIRKYKTLSMYDLQNGVTAADLVDGKSLCIATSFDKRHEICELLLPDKLLQSKQNGKIKKDRDFRVQAGGFSPQQVTEIKHIPGTGYCAVAQKDGNVCIWEMGNEDTDLMKEYRPIREKCEPDYPISMAVSEDSNKSKLVIGSCLDNILLVDTETWTTQGLKSDKTSSEKISSIQFFSSNKLLCCSEKGNLSIIDTRTKSIDIKENSKHNYKKSSHWLISNCCDQSDTVLQMSNEGEVVLLDKRCLSEPVSSSHTDLSTTGNYEALCVQQSPEGNRFSMSGFDGCVYLFNTKDLQSEQKTLEPVFIHEGHVINSDSQSESVLLTKHLWHPMKKDLIISCGNEGSIHAWQWNDG